MARDRDDDYDDRPPVQTTNPGSAKAAAILWIIAGAAAIILGLLSIANFSVGTIITLFVGVAFLVTGIQTLTGTVSGIMGAGIASIILAAIAILIGASAFIVGAGAAGAGGGALGAIIMIAGAIYLFGGAFLLIAGILAIVGCKKYLRWKAYKKGQSGGSRSRRRDYDEEEEDDRPRKRRVDDDD